MHRFHRGFLEESMKTRREFKSLGECLEILIAEHNELFPWFQISTRDIVIVPYGDDDRIGWNDCFLLCCVGYYEVSDKEGYLKYFGGMTYMHPVQILGMVSTDYKS